MKLSVCLIAKDEERNISRALQSVAGVADEIIVADTGSTDRTQEKARELGAVVREFPWVDDFAAARNCALDQARCDWILWLDADEELLPECKDELRGCLRRPDALGFLVVRQDLQGSGSADYFSEMWQLRLFRRRPDLRFTGRCHPDFRPPLTETAAAEGKHVYQSAIRLRHHGYVEALKPAKLRRAAHLLKLELQDRPGQLYYQIEYGRTLLSLGDARGQAVLQEATQAVYALRHRAIAPLPLAASLLEYLLLAPRHVTNSPWTVEELHALAQRWFPASAPLLWLRAQFHFRQGDFRGASEWLERLVHFGSTRTYDKSISFDPRILGDDLRLNLAVCCTRLGRLDQAEALLEDLLKSPAVGPQARQNLSAVRELQQRFRQSASKPADMK